jgi:NADH-quinone oxidoreductase subunit I
MAYGLGVLRGMGYTLRHFFDSFIVGHNEQPAAAGDLPHPFSGRAKWEAGMPTQVGGLITVQYPDEKLPLPERFRFIPFLVYDEEPDAERAGFDGIRCTACGICAKVCPPQCIWMVQGKGDDGRPRPVATEFYIDASICMSCGLCAEYCPFDAIKMDHDYEFSSYDRHESWVFNLQELLHPAAYHASIHPNDYAREVEDKKAKEEAKRKREAAKAAKAAATAETSGESDDEEAALRARKAEARKQFLEEKRRREAESGGSDDESAEDGSDKGAEGAGG